MAAGNGSEWHPGKVVRFIDQRARIDLKLATNYVLQADGDVPRITTIRNMRLYMYADDHPPPHVHVQSPDASVRVNLSTLLPMDPVPRNLDLTEAMAFIRNHRRDLLLEWARLNEREP